MWRNYLTTGLRSLARNRTYAFINIFGLAIGMAACLMILIFVRYERSYDAWLPGAENVYQFQTHYLPNETRPDGYLLQMAAFASRAPLLKDFPQVESAVFALSGSPVVIRNGESTVAENAIFVDGPFLDVLRLPLVRGDPRTALAGVGQLILSESEAAKRFGGEDPIGQTLTLVSGNRSADYRVAGIFRDLPRRSHMKFDIVARFDPQSRFADEPGFLTAWGWQSGWVYARLRPGADAEAINRQFPAWEKRNIPTERSGDRETNQGEFADFRLVNVRDVHLGAAQQGSMTPGNDERTIATFAVVAALILGMACVNFTNLATARAGQRAREVALRKVLGGTRRQLIVQFIGESVLVAALAMIVALALVELLLPAFGAMLKADLAMTYVGEGGLLLPVLGLVVVVGIAGGLYPAVYLSRFQPARILKANRSSTDVQGSGGLRNLLVVAQFAVSIGLIICTAVVYAQTIHARTVDPGYQREGLLQIETGRRQVQPLTETLARQLRELPGVVAVGRTGIGVDTGDNRNTNAQLPGRAEPVLIGMYNVDADFFRTMGIKRLAGRDFDAARPRDDATTPFPQRPDAERALVARGVNVVVNALAARRMGFASPAEAVGKTFKVGLTDNEYGMVPATIVGVVEDSRFRSIRDPLEPIMFTLHRSAHLALLVRYETSDPAALRQRIETLWRQLAPDVPFEAEYAEDVVRDLYDVEAARARLFAVFAGLAVIIGCLGLFGLAAFTAERRTKEIGIRKVLGARTRDIVRLLVWQFSRPVLVANLIAWPVAWWVMRDWLNGFDARIDLSPAFFILAGIAALAVAGATIIGHATRVARASPVLALRYE